VSVSSKEFLTIREAAEINGVSTSMLRKLGKTNFIAMYRDSSSNMNEILFEKDELQRYFDTLNKTPKVKELQHHGIKILSNKSEPDIARQYLRHMRFLRNALEISNELALSVAIENPDGVNAAIEEVLDTISSARIVKVLRLRLTDDNMTFEDVAKEFSVTRERIRQIEAKGLRILRHPKRRAMLAMLIGLTEYFKHKEISS
jgi:hypothetical protein